MSGRLGFWSGFALSASHTPGRAKPSVRGQGLTEASLAMTVFIVVLLTGIHFSEVVFAQMKVTEAASSTMWDITAGRMHTWPLDVSDTSGAVATANGMTSRYNNFDGRVVAPSARATPSFTQVLTSADNMQVQCNVGAGLNFFPTLLMPQYRLVYRDVEGVQCRASADIRHGGVMRMAGLLEGSNGMFKAKEYDARGAAAAGTYRTCAMGRAGAGCNQQLKMMVDDWGMSNGGGAESNICPVIIWGIPCPTNLPYWTSTFIVYTATSLPFGVQSGADRNLIRAVYGRSPFWIPIISSPTSFYLSFTGEDELFETITPWATDPIGWSWVWQTTPYLFWPTYLAAHISSSGHYLGQDQTSTAAMP